MGKYICRKKIAVCILAYNRLSLLRETITSVFNSSCKDYKLFILNDNSTDGTNDYLTSLKKEKEFIEIRHKKNIGMGENANYILNNIDAKYYLMLHDDDILEVDYLNEVLNLADSESDIAVVGTGICTINENGKKVEEIVYPGFKIPIIMDDKEYLKNHIDGLAFPWSGSLLNSKKIGNLRFNFLEHPYCADTVFLNTLILGNKVAYIPKALFNSRFHKDQVTKKMQKTDLDLLFKEWVFDFEFYRKILKEKEFDKSYIKKHNIAINTIMLHLLITSPNFKYYFKFLFSKYFKILLLSPKNILRVFYKFFKLLNKFQKK